MITPESTVEATFSAALAKRSPEERGLYLDGACNSDPELRRRVARLLEAHPKLGNFLQADATGRLTYPSPGEGAFPPGRAARGEKIRTRHCTRPAGHQAIQ
jgi:hypothetical protein